MSESFTFLGTVVQYQAVLYAYCTLVALLVCLVMCRKELGTIFAQAGVAVCVCLGLLVAGQFCVYFFFAAPKHAVYIDEFKFMEAGKHIFMQGCAIGYHKGIGWPVLLSLAYRVFGLSNYVAIWASAAMGVFVATNIFFITFLIGRKKLVALSAAVLYAISPVQFFWSVTAERHIPALFVITLAMVFSLLYYQSGKQRLLWLSLLAWTLAIQIRGEHVLFLILFYVGMKIFMQEWPKRDFNFYLPLAVALNFAIPSLIRGARYLFAFSRLEQESGGTMVGANVSVQNLMYNLLHWLPKLFNGAIFPLVMSVFVFVGFVYLMRMRRKLAWFLVMWFCLLAVVYFSSWFQVYGSSFEILGKTRLFLFFFPILVICAAYGVALPSVVVEKRYGKILSGVFLLITFLSMPPYYKTYSLRQPSLELEAKVVGRMRDHVSADCVIIAQFPSIINSVNEYKVVKTQRFLEADDFRQKLFDGVECILFLEDIAGKYYSSEMTSRMKENYTLSPTITFSQPGETYICYRVRQKEK